MIAKILEDLEVSKKSLFLKCEIELILTQSYQMICKLRNMSMEQTNKFVDQTNPDFFNPYNKKAILYIDEPLTPIQKNKILNTISEDVTLVNSLEGLLLIMK